METILWLLSAHHNDIAAVRKKKVTVKKEVDVKREVAVKSEAEPEKQNGVDINSESLLL